MLTEPAKRVPTDDDKRISGITLRTKRYVLDARYATHSDWWEHVNAQDVQFLLAIIDQQQAELVRAQEQMASLEAAYDNLNPVSSNPWKDM
ncbi:MAG: hypothetical protein ACYDBJ_06190 [Aggregatilineales bacterium]